MPRVNVKLGSPEWAAVEKIAVAGRKSPSDVVQEIVRDWRLRKAQEERPSLKLAKQAVADSFKETDETRRMAVREREEELV